MRLCGAVIGGARTLSSVSTFPGISAKKKPLIVKIREESEEF